MPQRLPDRIDGYQAMPVHFRAAGKTGPLFFGGL